MKLSIFTVFLGCVLLAGCATSQVSSVSRNQIRIGMTLQDTWTLYGWKLDEIDTWKIPQFTVYPITENKIGDCFRNTYRYWLRDNNNRESPYLLIFESCKLPNYDEVEAERQRRIDNYKQSWQQLLESDPNAQKEYKALYKEMKLDPGSEEILLELMAETSNPDELLPQNVTTSTLISIQLDEQTISNNIQQKQLNEIKSNQDQMIQQQRRMLFQQ